MAKMHIKGRILQLLQSGDPRWEYEIADVVISEYGYADNPYWRGTVRMTLTDLFSGGLIEPVEQKLGSEKGSDGNTKLLFKFVLTEFGFERMSESKLTLGRKEEVV